MQLNIKQIENTTRVKHCSNCDVDINFYKVKFECLLELDLEILASSEQHAEKLFSGVLSLIDIEELVDNAGMFYISTKKLTLN